VKTIGATFEPKLPRKSPRDHRESFVKYPGQPGHTVGEYVSLPYCGPDWARTQRRSACPRNLALRFAQIV